MINLSQGDIWINPEVTVIKRGTASCYNLMVRILFFMQNVQDFFEDICRGGRNNPFQIFKSHCQLIELNGQTI